MNIELDEQQMKWLLEALDRIPGCRGEYPTGFEALVMSIQGEGKPGSDSLAQAIRDAGQSIAYSLESLAEAIRENKKS